MRKKKYGIILIVVIVLSGCSTDNIHVEKESTPQITPQETINVTPEITSTPVSEKEHYITEPKLLEVINQTASITIEDEVEDSYIECMEYELTNDEIEELKIMKEELVEGDIPSKTTAFYRLKICDKEGNVLDNWHVNTEHKTESETGVIMKGTGKLDQWLKGIEERNKITFERIWERTPGRNYLKGLTKVNEMVMNEFTENNFVKGVFDRLDESEIRSLQEIMNEIKISDCKEEDVECYYELAAFGKNGDALYEFRVTRGGKIYTNGYEMTGESLKQWLEQIENKYGL